MSLRDKLRSGKLFTRVTRWATPANGTQIAPADSNRVAVIFSTQTANAMIDNISSVSFLFGMLVTTTNKPLVCDIETWGDWVKQALFVAGIGAAPNLTVIEVIAQASLGSEAE